MAGVRGNSGQGQRQEKNAKDAAVYAKIAEEGSRGEGQSGVNAAEVMA
jgi:hypothetical protein